MANELEPIRLILNLYETYNKIISLNILNASFTELFRRTPRIMKNALLIAAHLILILIAYL